MIKCLVVEDEPLALKLMSSYIEKIDFLSLEGAFTNPLDALSFLNSNTVDLVFLDIQMPELNGMQLAKVINANTSVVFTTAYPDYAVQGFEIQALDYLVKPISFERFVSSVNRLAEQPDIEKKTETEPIKYLFVKTEYRLQKVLIDDICFFKGMGDYTAIVTQDQKIMTLENMKSFEKKLPPELFIRTHRSYIIAKEKIDFIEKNRIKILDELIPIGQTYQEKFWDSIKK